VILCVYSVRAALRAKTTYSLLAILLEESKLSVELAEALIPNCWTKKRTTHAKDINRKLLFQNIDKL